MVMIEHRTNIGSELSESGIFPDMRTIVHLIHLLTLVYANVEKIIVKGSDFASIDSTLSSPITLTFPYTTKHLVLDPKAGTNAGQSKHILPVTGFRNEDTFEVRLCWPASLPIDVAFRVCNEVIQDLS